MENGPQPAAAPLPARGTQRVVTPAPRHSECPGCSTELTRIGYGRTADNRHLARWQWCLLCDWMGDPELVSRPLIRLPDARTYPHEHFSYHDFDGPDAIPVVSTLVKHRRELEDAEGVVHTFYSRHDYTTF